MSSYYFSEQREELLGWSTVNVNPETYCSTNQELEFPGLSLQSDINLELEATMCDPTFECGLLNKTLH